jgi:endoribonuclease Dicer
MREQAVCGSVLAWVAVKKLALHKVLLVNNVALSAEIVKHLPELETLSCQDIVQRSWAYDPPKILSDVFESLVAAILVDSGYNLDKLFAVVEGVLSEVLELLCPDLERDPVSQLMVWTAQSGCSGILFQ